MRWDPFKTSDEQLMVRVRATGDEKAFALLVRRWERPIRRLCARMIGDDHIAEELAQEIFARLFIARTGYEARAKFSTYLWRIALNRCCDEQRRAKRETAAMAGLEPPVATLPNADQLVIENERAVCVKNAVLSLADEYRKVVALRHYEGMKFREIAEILDIPEGTVKSRMAEALSRLSRRLKPLLKDEGGR